MYESTLASPRFQTLLIMSEMLMACMIFGLLAVSAAWWGGKRGGTTPFQSFLISSGIAGPIILTMFRIDPIIHNMSRPSRTIEVFILMVSIAEYIVGAALILQDAFGSRYQSYFRVAYICTGLFSVILIVLLVVDISFTWNQDSKEK